MKAIFSRRHTIAGSAALVAGSVWPGILAAQAGTGFDPPDGPMLLSRRLVREMRGGARLVVTREWDVRFAPLGKGYRLDGTQRSVSVDAPAALEPLAEFERVRRGDGKFPILLNTNGGFLGGTSIEDNALLRQAIDKARSMMAAGDKSRDTERNAFLAALRQSAARFVSRWPDDLFFPARLSHVASRELAMPNGANGSIDIAFEAGLALAGNCMDHAKRTITTRVADTARTSIESWKLHTP